MVRNLVCAAVVLAITVGFATAEEFRAIITKVDGGKVTFTKVKRSADKKFEKGEPATLPTAATVKVMSAKFNKETKKLEAGTALDGGLKTERLQNIGEKGVFGNIVTDSDGKTITEIHLMQFDGKFGGKKRKKTT